MRRKWLAGTMMLKQETQDGDIDMSDIMVVKIVISKLSSLTKNDCQELNKTDKASQGMTNQKNKDDGDKQQRNCNLSPSVVSFRILSDIILQPLGPLPHLPVDRPVQSHQDRSGQ